MSAATNEAGKTTIALQVIEADESEEPRADGKPSTYQGRHRGADRLRQLASVGWVLAVVAVLLAGGGTVLFWVLGPDEERPLVDAAKIADLCELVVNEELLTPWADVEQARNPAERSEEKVRTFDCTYSAEYAGDEAYRLVTVFATVQVYETPAKARAAYAGVLEFEETEGHATSATGGVGEQAVLASVSEGEESETRLHAQEANATVSMNVFFTGTAPEGTDAGGLAKDLGAGLVDTLPRVRN